MTSMCMRRVTVLAAAILGFGIAAANAQPAASKSPPLPKWKYKINKPSETLRAKSGDLGTARSSIRKVLAGELPIADYSFDSFFTGYYFPMMTLDDESVKFNKAEVSIADMRMRFFRDYMERAIPPIHAHLASLALTELPKIAVDDFHPSARYNAMLMLGMLNDQELVRTGDASAKTGPSPHTRALQPMLDIYNAAETPDLVKLAALIGFVRHLEWDPWRSEDRRMPADKRAEIINLLIAIVEAKEPPEGRTEGGHQWMRRKATDGLGFAVVGKLEKRVIDVLEKVMDDDKDRAEVRSAAAIAFGRANFKGVQQYDVKKAVERLAKVTEGVFASEVHRLTEQRKKEEAQVGVVGASQGVGGGGGVPIARQEFRNPNQIEPEDPYYYRVDYSRRKIRAGLFGVEGALNGVDDRPSMNHARNWLADRQAAGEVRGLTLLASAKPGPQQKAEKDAVENFKKEIDRLVKVIENGTDGLDRESYEDAIKTAAAEITQAIGGAAPAAKQPAGPVEEAAAKQPAVAEELPE